jgi:hypothetical protein
MCHYYTRYTSSGLTPNAQAEARATRYKPTLATKRTLWPVASSAVILIEAPSSAYRRTMLSWITVPHTRRRPHALLDETASILLRHRFACPPHVSLPLAPGWCEACPLAPARWPRTVPQGPGPLPGGCGRLCRMALSLGWAGRPLGPRRDAVRPRPRALDTSEPWRQSHPCSERRPKTDRRAPWREAPPGVGLSRGAAGHAGAAPATSEQPPKAHPRSWLRTSPGSCTLLRWVRLAASQAASACPACQLGCPPAAWARGRRHPQASGPVPPARRSATPLSRRPAAPLEASKTSRVWRTNTAKAKLAPCELRRWARAVSAMWQRLTACARPTWRPGERSGCAWRRTG